MEINIILRALHRDRTKKKRGESGVVLQDCVRMKKCRCRLWGDKFWNDFFHPRHPGVFIILLDTVIAIAFTVLYILMAIYVGALTDSHADAFLIIFVSNLFIIIMCFLVMHFLTLHSDDLTVMRCGLVRVLNNSNPIIIFFKVDNKSFSAVFTPTSRACLGIDSHR